MTRLLEAIKDKAQCHRCEKYSAKITAMRLMIGKSLVALSIIALPTAAYPGEKNICEGLSMGKDVQVRFQGYEVATCLRGMGPTHMVVINNSRNSSEYSVKVFSLRRENKPPRGKNVYYAYHALDQGISYNLNILNDASASFFIKKNDMTLYSDWSGANEVSYGDLLRP